MREREREFSKLFSINAFLRSTFSYNLIVCIKKESQNFLYTCNIFIVHSILGTFRPRGLHQSGYKNITLHTHAILRCCLTLKAPVTTAADDNFIYLFFSEKTNLDISCESSAKQTIHMKCQDLFSLKIKTKKENMSSATNFAWRFKG